MKTPKTKFQAGDVIEHIVTRRRGVVTDVQEPTKNQPIGKYTLCLDVDKSHWWAIPGADLSFRKVDLNAKGEVVHQLVSLLLDDVKEREMAGNYNDHDQVVEDWTKIISEVI